ncbi:MAG: hypothetical protein HC927_00210 [Deltaproteobacteria bacterium]|nr:hypothetical protein [Deltaproteobacteria bacterium]
MTVPLKGVYLDFETRSPVDLVSAGGENYARHPETRVLIAAWAVDDGPIQAWWPEWAAPGDPAPLQGLVEALQDRPLYAWNAAFERKIWNNVFTTHPSVSPLPITHFRCVAAQAAAANLPQRLDSAAKVLKLGQKNPAKSLMSCCAWLSTPGASTRRARSGSFGRFKQYCIDDVWLLREIHKKLPPFSATDWQDYAVSEAINDRGVPIDEALCIAASEYYKDELEVLNTKFKQLTGVSLQHHVKKGLWLKEQLKDREDLLQHVMVWDKGSKRLSCGQDARRDLHEALLQEETRSFDHVVLFLELLDLGGATSSRKYDAMVSRAHKRRIHGAFVFSGAGQTGRYSSRGAQFHNFRRDGYSADEVVKFVNLIRDKQPLSQTQEVLGRLLRAAVCVPEGRALVWGDLSQIEARMFAWLSDTPGGARVLDAFRAYDAGTGRDYYSLTAEMMFKKTVRKEDPERQYGKVASLFLQYGGAVGAYRSGARAYGFKVTDETAQHYTKLWRDANPWAVKFWEKCMSAAREAYYAPGTIFEAGRLRIGFHPSLLGGSLFTRLPSGRHLIYPQTRMVTAISKFTGRPEKQLCYSKLVGPKWVTRQLYGGLLSQGPTQGASADVLRAALRQLPNAIGHVHDEVICEVDEDAVDAEKQLLKKVLSTPPVWAAGLPLATNVSAELFWGK